MPNKTINELEIYRDAMEIGEEIWSLVIGWESFAKGSLGRQLTRSADSIAANLSEGYGRDHFKENLNFCYYSRGSLEETQTWIEKASRRNLIEQEVGRELYAKMEVLKKRLNAHIKTIRAQT